MAEEWRSNARLQYGVHSVWVWGPGLPMGGIQLTHVTRIQDKSALFTGLLMTEALRWLQEKKIIAMKPDRNNGWPAPVTTLEFWADGAPTYRSSGWLAFPGLYWPEEFKTHTVMNNGVASHLKGAVDRYFSQLDARLDRWVQAKTLVSIEDVIECWQSTPGPNPEHFFHFTPTVKRSEFARAHRPLKLSTLPAPIRATHQYSFQIVDSRRLSYVRSKDQCITGVATRSHVLPGLGIGGVALHHCQLVPEGAVEADSEEEGADVGSADAVTGQTRDILEWRTSYRSTEPENAEKNYDKTMNKLIKSYNAFKYVLPRIKEAARRMEWRTNVDAKEAAAERSRAYDAAKREQRAAAKLAKA